MNKSKHVIQNATDKEKTSVSLPSRLWNVPLVNDDTRSSKKTLSLLEHLSMDCSQWGIYIDRKKERS